MVKLPAFINDYKKIEQPVKNCIASEFFIQLVNATFMNILPLYLVHENFSNQDIALFITFRFIGVFALALSLGNYIKGRAVIGLFFISNIGVPLFGIGIVAAIYFKLRLLTYVFLLLWGASFTFMQLPVFPFILRNCSRANQTAAIALSYCTWSFAGIVSSCIIAILDFISPTVFDEKFILLLFSVLGFGGLHYLAKTKEFNEKIEEHEKTKLQKPKQSTDWLTVTKALVPLLVIATGAGLTIPFISLFFEEVHNVHKGPFSVLSFIASFLVAYCALLVPRIKKKVGYKVAIPATQSLAVISLVALATTQLYNQYSIALVIASVCYLLRQPLMNMAGPMTSEVVLKYVGRRNREITSALTSAIWSGSWVLSGLLVTLLFSYNVNFANIFLITSLFYAFGVVMYYFLILDYTRKEESGLIES